MNIKNYESLFQNALAKLVFHVICFDLKEIE